MTRLRTNDSEPPLLPGATDPAAVPAPWVEVLVDCPEVQGLLTYAVPSGLTVRAGDVLGVPLRRRVVGAIAIRFPPELPPELPPERVKPIREVVATGLFAPSYWTLLERVASYYAVPLVKAIALALPPGLLRGSRARVRLTGTPAGDLPPAAAEIVRRLQAAKSGSLTRRHLERHFEGAQAALAWLRARGWVETYLELPAPPQAQQRKAVCLVAAPGSFGLSARQREILHLLQAAGGEVWLADFLERCKTTTATLHKLAAKGYLSIETRERLRTPDDPEIAADRPLPLTPAQQQAVAAIAELNGEAQVLLHGVTGSGKTEVYLQAIASVLAAGKSALVLVPEIGLTPQLCDRFRARFGDRVRTYHSGLSVGERYDAWRQMLDPQPQVAIGTRSAVFAPLPHLGLIVLDEEHDASFKQTRPAPTYHARTVAAWRSRLSQCPLLLGSATPALTTWHAFRSEHPQRRYLRLPERVRARPLPPVEITDMRQELQAGNRSVFGRPLQAGLAEILARGEQGILFVPRRGHSTFVSCRSCGAVLQCPHCDVALAYHHAHPDAAARLRCHYCNFTRAQPPACPACHSPYLKHFGSGTQRIVRELQQHFPEARCLRFDSDATRSKGAHRALLAKFAAGEADLLVGTQMLAKGLDLAGVTLVGAIAIDGVLNRSDYLGAERAFQVLTQVAGRAGRGDTPGRAIVQTYSPEAAIVQAARDRDYERFAASELQRRAEAGYPPFAHLVLLQVSGLEGALVAQVAAQLALTCQRLASNCEVLGPAPAAVARVARRERWQVLLKSRAPIRLDWRPLQALCPREVALTVDVDPLEMS